MNPWQIAGQTVLPGEKKQVLLCPNVEGYTMPATLLCGQRPGITVVATAGIHSGEYPGVAALTRLAGSLKPSLLKGRLLLVHNVNTSGFWAKSADLIPEDGANLNSCYPGRPDGTVGERIADYFVRELFPQADFVIDLHSGGQMEPLTPCLFFPAGAAESVRNTALAAARATNLPYLVASQATSGEYSYAAKSMGIPGLLLERGFCGGCKEEWVDAYCKDIRLLLAHFGMIDSADDGPICEKVVFHKTIYLTSSIQGLWYPAVSENQQVRKGQLLGRVADIWGNPMEEYQADGDGVVLYYTCGLAVNPGNPLVAYGLQSALG